MLTKQRLIEAERNFKVYLKDGFISKQKESLNIISILLKNSDESLSLADELYRENKSDLWVVVISYYSMFYLANAVLRNKGWSIGDKLVHKVTSDLIIHLLRNDVENLLIENYELLRNDALLTTKTGELIGSYDAERRKRGIFQYDMSIELKHSKAKTSLERAKKFNLEFKRLL